MISSKTILITGASTGFGRDAAETLTRECHRVFASFRDIAGRNKSHADALRSEDINVVELDVTNNNSVESAVRSVVSQAGQIDSQFHDFCRRYQNFSKGVVEERKTAPWQEVKITENINLFELMPHFRLNPGDGGLYVNKASVVSRHPDHPDSTDEQNVGLYRFQVKGPTRLSAQFVPEHDIALHFQAAER